MHSGRPHDGLAGALVDAIEAFTGGGVWLDAGRGARPLRGVLHLLGWTAAPRAEPLQIQLPAARELALAR